MARDELASTLCADDVADCRAMRLGLLYEPSRMASFCRMVGCHLGRNSDQVHLLAHNDGSEDKS